MQGFIPIGNPITFGISVITTILGALFGPLFGGSGTKQLEDQIVALQTAVTQSIDQVSRFAWTVAYALGSLFQLLHKIWIGFVDDVWSFLKKLASIVKKLMEDVLSWILKALKWVWNTALPNLLKAIAKLRQWLNKLYVNYIRKALIYLQYVRRILILLEIFHLKFAAKLDAWLVQWQSKILGPFFYVLHVLNMTGTWVNLLVNIRGIIQRAVFVNTMYAYQSDWTNMFWWGQSSAQPGTPVPAPTPQPTPPPVQQLAGDMVQWAQTDTGAFANDAQLAYQAAASV